MIRKMSLFFFVSLMIPVVSCGLLPGTPPAEAVLEGDWMTMSAEGVTAVVTFNDQGVVVKIDETREDGVNAILNVEDSTTTLDGNMVTITIPTSSGQVELEGTLSEDQNTLTGTLTREIVFENVMITIPEGDITLSRIVVDPCADVTCDDGETCVDGECVAADPCDGVTCGDGESCVDGECVATDPCDGVTCGDGETCVDGECVATDPCDGVTCGDGETCVDGECVAADPCDGVTCGDGETCMDGECVADDPCAGVTCGTCEECVDGQCTALAGTAATGEAFYAANGCANCHGADASGGGGGPSLRETNCAAIFDHLSGKETHPGGTVDGVTEQDAADLEAWLASLE